MIYCDFLIIGSGIVGLAIARELSRCFNDARIIILEKEKALGAYASGRNSGVIHAGFYYTDDSLKARFTRQGNEALRNFCSSRNLKINPCGKLVVARNRDDLKGLDILLKRAQKNGVSLERITTSQVKSIEPMAKTYEYALFSPTTASVNPLEVVLAMAKAVQENKVEIHYRTKYIFRSKNKITTTRGTYQTSYLINAAGLFADRIAKDFGFSRNYYLLPFKGLYLYGSQTAPKLKTNIYPVPNLANPFLGVHFTSTVDGTIKIGPTAIPCFWREQYNWTDNFNFKEFLDILYKQIGLGVSANFNFRNLAFEEICKHFKPYIIKLAGELVENLHSNDFKSWGKPGIRAQLVNRRNRNLEMDFVVEFDDSSLHVLNAVSPAFTCSIPFAEYIVDLVEKNYK